MNFLCGMWPVQPALVSALPSPAYFAFWIGCTIIAPIRLITVVNRFC